MAICSRLLFLFALFYSCCLNNTLVYGAGDVGFHVVGMNSQQPATTCSASTEERVHGLRIASRYGPCSPLGHEKSIPDASKILLKDQSRVRSINSFTPSKYTIDDEAKVTRVPLFDNDIGSGNFVVTVGFGTPKRDFTLIFDTGSELTWMQCQPCSGHCYHQQDHTYNSSESSTYSNCSSSSCDYSNHYHDDSYSNGYLIRDTLTISPSDVFPNFVFGCGQNNSDKFGTAAGVLGAGQNGPNSLISQTSTKFAKTFCYCLPPAASSTGFLLYGYQALETCQTNKVIPLESDPQRLSLYFVNLVGISIGNIRLKVSSYVNSSPNTILDSGTVITRLPPSVYSALRSAFKKFMSQYPPARRLKPNLDTCYNLEKYKHVKIPSMVLHFANSVDVNLDASAVIWAEKRSQVCLAFAGNDQPNELTIIGNHQQRKLNVLYDIQDRKVAFGDGGCGK